MGERKFHNGDRVVAPGYQYDTFTVIGWVERDDAYAVLADESPEGYYGAGMFIYREDQLVTAPRPVEEIAWNAVETFVADYRGGGERRVGSMLCGDDPTDTLAVALLHAIVLAAIEEAKAQ